jgi:RNA-directed DNA polymerase
MAKGASKSRGSGCWKTRRTLVNISELELALGWAEPRVLEIQAKLHRWAAADPGRRFDDLFNLVADPAFLLVAWARVRGNKGARTAGVDGHTALSVTAAMGVEGFLDRLRASLKDRSFRPLPVRERMIPKAGGKKRRLGIATDDSYCPPATTCRDVLDRCGAVLVRPASAELVMRAWQVGPTFPGCLSAAGGAWCAGRRG